VVGGGGSKRVLGSGRGIWGGGGSWRERDRGWVEAGFGMKLEGFRVGICITVRVGAHKGGPEGLRGWWT